MSISSMHKFIFKPFRIFFFVFLLFINITPSFAQDAEELVKKAEDLLRGLTSKGKYTMIVERPTWKREIKFRFWDQRDGDKSLVIVDSPVKDRGTAFLKIKADLWMFIPRVERIIRIPPSMMMNSWMGSDFTNDDLVKESSISRDYSKRIIKKEVKGKETIYTLELIPKHNAPVVWGKIIYTLKTPGYLPIKAQYYNEKGELVREVRFSDVEKMGGRVIPAKMEAVPVKKEGRRTVIILENVRFNVKIPSSIFSLKHLKRMMR